MFSSFFEVFNALEIRQQENVGSIENILHLVIYGPVWHVEEVPVHLVFSLL